MSSSVSTATPSRPTSPRRARVVGVVPHQARHVERRRQAGLPVVEQVVEALVRLLGGAEAGELAHRPQAAAVHARVHAARERELARQADLARRGQVVLGVERHVSGTPRERRERDVALGRGRVTLAPELEVVAEGSRCGTAVDAPPRGTWISDSRNTTYLVGRQGPRRDHGDRRPLRSRRPRAQAPERRRRATRARPARAARWRSAPRSAARSRRSRPRARAG